MEGILDAVRSLLDFPLTNVVTLIITLCAAFWMIKLRPAEQEKANNVIESVRTDIGELKGLMLDNKTNIKDSMSGNSKALTRNSEVLNQNKQMLKEFRLYIDNFSDNCTRLNDVLDGILETQGAIHEQYQKVSDEIGALRTSYALMEERLSDIKQTILK